jgi:hypothetical protein
MTGTGCLWTIEFLKLRGEDTIWDGQIDSWNIHPDFVSDGSLVVANESNLSSTSYWQPIFPNTIHVSRFEVYGYPHKDTEFSWRDSDPSLQVAPYIQISMTLQPSWKQKRKIRGSIPQVDLTTTIQLTNLDFRN